MPEIVTVKNLTVTTGSTINIPVDLASGFLDSQLHGYRLTGSPTLSVADYVLVPQGTAILNQRVVFYWEANVTYGVGTAITIFGKTIPSAWATKNFIATCVYDGSAWQVQLVCGGEEDGWIEASDLAADSVITSKILDLNVTTAKIAAEAVTNAKLAQMATVTVKGNDGAGPAVPQDLTMTEVRTILDQDVTLTGDVTGTATQTFATGVTTIATTIAAGAIDTAMIADDQVTVAKVENNLTYEVINLLVSFEAAGGTTPSVGDFKIKMPYPGTVSEIYAYAVKAIAATDNGTIQAKNNAGTNMTAGLVTFTASDARGTAYTVSPSADNTFVAGDILTFTTAKATAGGLVQLSIKVVRS